MAVVSVKTRRFVSERTKEVVKQACGVVAKVAGDFREKANDPKENDVMGKTMIVMDWLTKVVN